MNATRKRVQTAIAAVLTAGTIIFAGSDYAQAKTTKSAPTAAHKTSTASVLTLNNLKNGSYQIPDSACGYTVVKLHDGRGTCGDIDVVLGRATFGKLTNKGEPGAVVHIAYKDPMFGWLQQMVFLVERQGKVLQIAELGLDEKEQLKTVELRDGNVLLETAAPDVQTGKIFKKCLKAELVESSAGCELTATKYNWLTTENNQEPAPKLVSLRH